MLTAASQVQLGGATLRTRLLLERRFRGHLVERSHLTYDGAVQAATRVAPAGDVAYLLLVRAGEVRISDGRVLRAPVALALSGDEFDRAPTQALTMRLQGDHTTSLELCLRRADLRVTAGLAQPPLTLPGACWDALEALRAAVDAAASAAAVGVLLAALADAGVVVPALADAIALVEDERIARLWSGIEPLYASFQPSATLGQLQAATGLSLRQLGRDVPFFLRTFALTTRSFRDIARVMRLRSAAILLSAPATTVGEVARVVGYASLDAMARAFRDGGLPAPSDVRARVATAPTS